MTSMRVWQPRTSSRNERRPLHVGQRDQLGHRLGHRDGVDGDVGEVDPRHRPLGRPPQVGLGQVVGRDPGQQVGGVDDEAVVEARPRGAPSATPARPGRRTRRPPRRRRGTRAGGPAGGRAPPSRRGPRRRRSPRGPGRSRWDFSSMRMEATSRNSDSWLKSISVALLGQDVHEGVDHREQRDVEDVDLVRGHQVQQEVDGALEDGRGDRVGHPPTLPNRGPLAHPGAAGCSARAPYHVAPWTGSSRASRPRATSRLGNYLGALRHWVVLPGRARRVLLRRRPPRADHRDRPGGPAGQHPRRRPQPPRRRARPGALHPLRPEPRARAHPADLAARVHGHHGRAAAHDPVQGQGPRARRRSGSGSSPTRA